MIDEIRITDLTEWDDRLVDELHEELARAVPPAVTVRLVDTRIELEIPESWPNLKRENLHRVTEKRLSKLEHDHGLSATVEKVDETDREDRDATFN